MTVLEIANTQNLSREAWLSLRRQGIGGSDAAAVMGVHPYRGPWAVWADKVGVLPEQPDTEAMCQGRDLEQYVAQRFSQATGLRVRRKRKVLQHDEYPFMLANVDRLIVGQRAGLEIKTASPLSVHRYRDNEYPIEYHAQIMHYMAVTGLEKWYLAVLILGTDLRIYEVERDEGDIAALTKAEQAFWNQYVLPRLPPPADATEGTTRALAAVYDRDDGTTLEPCPCPDALEEYTRLKAERDALEKRLNGVENQIKAAMGEAVRTGSATHMATWTTRTRHSLDEKALAAAHPDIDLVQFRKTTTYRQFSVKEDRQWAD